MLGHADQHQRAIALEQRGIGIKVVAGGHGVEDQVEAAAMRLHLRAIARNHHLVRTEVVPVLPLGLAGGERDHVRAHRMRDLDAHVAQATDADDADLLPRPRTPVAQRRIGGDACAQQRRHRGQLRCLVVDAQDEVAVHDDALRIAAQGVAGCVGGGSVVGADHPALAVLLEAFVAGAARLAASDHAAHADEIPDLEAASVCSHGGHPPDNLVPGNAGKQGAGPFRAHGVQVRMADAAVGDVDLHVTRSRRTPFDRHGLQRLVGGLGAVGFGRHRRILSGDAASMRRVSRARVPPAAGQAPTSARAAAMA